MWATRAWRYPITTTAAGILLQMAAIVSTTAEVFQGFVDIMLQGLVDNMLDTSCGCGKVKVGITATEACLTILVLCCDLIHAGTGSAPLGIL